VVTQGWGAALLLLLLLLWQDSINLHALRALCGVSNRIRPSSSCCCWLIVKVLQLQYGLRWARPGVCPRAGSSSSCSCINSWQHVAAATILHDWQLLGPRVLPGVLLNSTLLLPQLLLLLPLLADCKAPCVELAGQLQTAGA
jgi:hypothetical protein